MEAKDKELAEMKDRLARLEALLPVAGAKAETKDTLHVPKKGS
jgi:hypothetical protein